jgi:uncharacterized protein (TIGR00645 family)
MLLLLRTEKRRPQTKRLHSNQTPEELLFASRWLLYSISLGLLIALAMYLANFFWQVGQMLINAPALITSDDEDHTLMVIIINLLDRAMVSSLIILTVMGGHQIYVRRFRARKKSDVPQWLDHVDTTMLKVKLGLAFTGISSVMLLEDLIKPSHMSKDMLTPHLIVHSAFVVTTFVMAVVWRLMHPQHNDKTPEHNRSELTDSKS